MTSLIRIAASLVGAALVFAACGVVPVGLSSSEREALDWARREWERALNRPLPPGLVIVSSRPMPERMDGYAIVLPCRSAALTVKSGLHAERQRQVMLHEIGHALRVQHNPNPASVMHATGPTTALLPEDVEQARRFLDAPWPLGGL